MIPFVEQLEEALSSSEEKRPKALALAGFKTGVGAGYESCAGLLHLLGFKVEEDGEGNIIFPEDGTDGMLYCCTALTEALVGEVLVDLNSGFVLDFIK